MNRLLGLAWLCLALLPFASAETRSAQDMAKECRVALDLFQDRVEKSFENTLFAGECIGYVLHFAYRRASLQLNNRFGWLRSGAALRVGLSGLETRQ